MSSILAARLCAALALTLAGCGGAADVPINHLVEAKNYDRSCTSVADCVPIFEGTLGCCGLGTTCPNAAIRADALPTYTRDAQRASTCMVPMGCPHLVIMCAAGRITCTEGTCALAEPPLDASAAD